MPWHGHVLRADFRIKLFSVTLSVAAACALAEQHVQVAGMVLLDPVDATPQDPESVLDSLKQLRGVPTLIVGGGADDGGCSPGLFAYVLDWSS